PFAHTTPHATSTLSLHDALPIFAKPVEGSVRVAVAGVETAAFNLEATTGRVTLAAAPPQGAAVSAGFAFDVPVRFDADRMEVTLDRKSTRLNSSHVKISYAVFCL